MFRKYKNNGKTYLKNYSDGAKDQNKINISLEYTHYA